MTKWEHCAVPVEIMHQLDDTGWELVSVDSGIAYFRRPKTAVPITVGPSEHKIDTPSTGPSV